jgi:DNA (cytosine-5)-methyltransferase 1
MSIQGFKSSPRVASSDTTATVVAPGDVESLEFQGKTFCKKSVYEYSQIGRQVRTVLVGILSFVGQDKAECIEVASFEETFIGEIFNEFQDKNAFDFELSDFPKYVQVVTNPESHLVLDLANFGDQSQEVPTLPIMIYQAQTDEDRWEAFGYYNSGECPQMVSTRCGRRSTRPTIIEYFAGAGGSHEAYKAVGFRTMQLVEKDDTAVESLKGNNPEDIDKVYHGCVNDAIDEDQAETPDVCHYSSPCCGFSRANRNGGTNDQVNNDLALKFVTMLQKKRPIVGCFENVMGMWRRKHVHYLINIIAGVLKSGYQIRCSKLNTADYGDPQSRNRLFMLVSKDGFPLPKLPLKQYGESLAPIVTVGDVLRNIGDTPVINSDLGCLDPSKPAPTITANGRQPMHPFKNRRLDDKDMLRLFSLPPESFVLEGSSKTKRRRQVGNMIPFKTMCAVAGEMMRVLEFKYSHNTSDLMHNE